MLGLTSTPVYRGMRETAINQPRRRGTFSPYPPPQWHRCQKCAVADRRAQAGAKPAQKDAAASAPEATLDKPLGRARQRASRCPPGARGSYQVAASHQSPSLTSKKALHDP
jgi:hypothetical protein